MYMGVRFVPSDNVEDIFVKWNWRKKSLKWSLSMNLDEFLLLYDAGVYWSVLHETRQCIFTPLSPFSSVNSRHYHC